MSETIKPDSSIPFSGKTEDGRRSNLLVFRPRTTVLDEQPEAVLREESADHDEVAAEKPGEAAAASAHDARDEKAPWA